MTFKEPAENGLVKQMHEAVEKAVREHNIAIEKLTEAQVVDAFQQAIACGDFQRLVRQDNGAQAVMYLPYAREYELETRVRELEEKIKALEHGTAMANERYKAVMENDAPLTEEEISAGWHFCCERDGLLVGPGMPEMQCCRCKEKS